MDKLDHYRNCIQTFLETKSHYRAHDKDIENELVFDLIRDHYQLMRGNLFVSVDECHRTQSGKLHTAMKW
jgi:type I site-specific restriction-modification system R (restriction) subunit